MTRLECSKLQASVFCFMRASRASLVFAMLMENLSVPLIRQGVLSYDSRRVRLEEKDAGMAQLPPNKRGTEDTPCMLEAGGACDTCDLGEQSKLQASDASSNHESYRDVKRCVVLG